MCKQQNCFFKIYYVEHKDDNSNLHNFNYVFVLFYDRDLLRTKYSEVTK
jgi:hypothetical protein